jgi:hypothetical protein
MSMRGLQYLDFKVDFSAAYNFSSRVQTAQPIETVMAGNAISAIM